MEKNINTPPISDIENVEEGMGLTPEQDPSLMESSVSDQIPIAEDDLAAEDQREELSEIMDNIEAKYREMNAEIFASKNQGESIKKELVKDVFVALQDAGIDIGDADAIREFLDLLEESNSDLYEMFVASFDGLLGAGALEGAEGIDPAGEEGSVERAGLTEPVAGLEGQTPPPMAGMPTSDSPASSPELSRMVSSPVAPPPASPPEAGAGDSLSGRFPNLAGR